MKTLLTTLLLLAVARETTANIIPSADDPKPATVKSQRIIIVLRDAVSGDRKKDSATELTAIIETDFEGEGRFYAWIVQPLPNAPTALWKVKPGAFGVLARMIGGRHATPSYKGIEAFDTCSLSMLGLGNFSKQNNLRVDVKRIEEALGERSRVAAALFDKVSKTANTLPPYKIAYITRTPMLLTSLLAVSASKAPIHFEVYVCAKSPARIEGLKVEQIETISRHLIETPEMEESELDSVVEPGFTVTRLTGSLKPDKLKNNLAISLDFLPVERR